MEKPYPVFGPSVVEEENDLEEVEKTKNPIYKQITVFPVLEVEV